MAPVSTLQHAGAQSSQQHGGRKHKNKKGGLLARFFGSFSGTGLPPGPVPRGGPILQSNSVPVPSSVACQAYTAPVALSEPKTPSHGPSANGCEGAPWLGYMTGLTDKYSIGKELGKGGNGVVRIVKNAETGEEFACKSIRKVIPEASDKKKSGHLESIRREVQVLTKLKGSLNIVKLEDVYEDEKEVHIVMELCKGGELWHAIGDKHYSERTVASYMRATLRTLAQCHAQHILHRDIKPGNFMLLTDDERAPLKAIDFGLAAPFDPEHLPRTDLGLEGTPWYMAPETLRAEWLPASDIWAAGVMAFQLLCGRFPFDDKKNVYAPAVTAIWRSVMNDELDFDKPWWNGISAEAKDFCRMLLHRDPAKRPTAKEALKHPWLKGNSSERSMGKKINQSVVARIQRFAAGSQFKRTVLQSIAAELLSHPNLASQIRGGDSNKDRCQINETTGRPMITTPDSACLRPLLQQLNLDGADSAQVDAVKLGEALTALGFRLAPSEVARLLEQVDLDGTGSIDRAAFAASQMDWRALQQNHAELWLDLAAKAFRSLDQDGNGVLDVDDLMTTLRAKLPPDEVQTALELALQEAGAAGHTGGVEGARSIDFEHFMQLLKVGSVESLDLYDDRLSVRSSSRDNTTHGSLDRLNSLLAAFPSSNNVRVGGSKHGAHGDVSMHSAVSEESDVSQLDQSVHHQPSPIAFRFDVGTGVPPPAAPPGSIAAAAGVGAAAPPPAAPNNGMVWRFDVAKKLPPNAPPPPPTIWRFDVDGTGDFKTKDVSATVSPFANGGTTTSSTAGGGASNAGVTSPASGSNGSAHGAGGSGSSRGGSTAAALGPVVAGLGRQGGYFDRRHHGSELYRNVALRALQAAGHPTRLDTVRE